VLHGLNKARAEIKDQEEAGKSSQHHPNRQVTEDVKPGPVITQKVK